MTPSGKPSTGASQRTIFVFWSNLAGRHGKGAALDARRKYGAVYGFGVGRTGDAYAIPTKGTQLKRLSLDDIKQHVHAFLAYARHWQDLTFQVTRGGCGLAGYSEHEISPFFANAPSNCCLPFGWGVSSCQVSKQH